MGAYDARVGAACQRMKAYERHKPAESIQGRHMPLIIMKQTAVFICAYLNVYRQSG